MGALARLAQDLFHEERVSVRPSRELAGRRIVERFVEQQARQPRHLETRQPLKDQHRVDVFVERSRFMLESFRVDRDHDEDRVLGVFEHRADQGHRGGVRRVGVVDRPQHGSRSREPLEHRRQRHPKAVLPKAGIDAFVSVLRRVARSRTQTHQLPYPQDGPLDIRATAEGVLDESANGRGAIRTVFVGIEWRPATAGRSIRRPPYEHRSHHPEGVACALAVGRAAKDSLLASRLMLLEDLTGRRKHLALADADRSVDSKHDVLGPFEHATDRTFELSELGFAADQAPEDRVLSGRRRCGRIGHDRQSVADRRTLRKRRTTPGRVHRSDDGTRPLVMKRASRAGDRACGLRCRRRSLPSVKWLHAAWIGALLGAGCGNSDDPCAADALIGDLSNAAAGTTVRASAGCRYATEIRIPAGVSLVGGEGSSVAALRVESASDEPTTEVRGVDVIASSGFGLVVVGDGEARIGPGVEVDITTGVGLFAQGLARLTLEGVTVVGPVTVAEQDQLPAESGTTASEYATHGVVLDAIGEAVVRNLVVSGFALHGVLAQDTEVVWSDGRIEEVRGIGFLASGGRARLERVAVREVFRGRNLNRNAFGVAAIGGAELDTDQVVVDEVSEGAGVYQRRGFGVHTLLRVSSCPQGGVWAEDVNRLELTEADLDANGLASILARETRELVVTDSSVTNTREQPLIRSLTETDIQGDGLQIARPLGPADIRKTRLEGNERAGILLDVEDQATDLVTFADVTVSTDEASRPRVAAKIQDGGAALVVPGWDDGITREGPIDAQADASADGLPYNNGIIGPCYQAGVAAPPVPPGS